MNTHIKIEEYKKNNDLAEIYQASSTVYAFAKKLGEDHYAQCTQFVKCRDFLNDVVRGQLLEKPIAIYGFKYTPKKDLDIDLNNIRFIIKDPNKAIEPALKKAKVILNYYETLMKTDEVTNYEMASEHVGIVTGPKEWLCSPTLTSLYSLIFRVGEHSFEIPDVTNLTDTYAQYIEANKANIHNQKFRDLDYLNTIYKKLEFFLANYKSVLGIEVTGYDHFLTDDMSINNFHNNTGIVAFMGTSSYMDKERKDKFMKDFEEKDVKKEVVPETKSLMVVHSAKNFGSYTGYTPGSIGFAFVNTFGNRRMLCHEPVSCREFLLVAFRALLTEDSDVDLFIHPTMQKGKKVAFQVDAAKVRLLVTVPGVGTMEDRMQHHKQEFFFAKKVLNYYEKMAGFKTSVISTVRTVDPTDKSYYSWLFTAGADWMCSPVLLSLYPLIIRAAKRYAALMLKKGGQLPTKIDDKNIVAIWQAIRGSEGITTAESSLSADHAMIVKLLKYSKDIFTATQEEAFFTKNKYAVVKTRKVTDHTYTNQIGINAFLSKNYINKKLVEATTAFMENVK